MHIPLSFPTNGTSFCVGLKSYDEPLVSNEIDVASLI